jgi:hypothetical protein
MAYNASPLFHITPYILFGCMWLAAAIIPIIAVDLPFSPAADVIALVGVFALARVFIALAAMDIGTAFGTLGARREMLVSFLAEPALLMVLFTASLISHSTQLPRIVDALAHHHFVLYPSLAFAGLAFVIVLLAENARIPVDNPGTHLELTMIHEAMILEYSARHLALVEWASSLKLFAYISIGIALFFPYGIAGAGDWRAAGHHRVAGQADIGGRRTGIAGNAAREDAHLSRAGIFGHRIFAGGAGIADSHPAGCLMGTSKKYTFHPYCCVAEKIYCLHIPDMWRGKLLSAPCICANSEFLEAPICR